MHHEKTDRIRVIIVEDEPPMLRFLHRIVSGMEGFQIAGECISAQEAMELLHESEAELLISDIRMPGMSGLQLAEQFRRISSDMHIIIITGYKSFEYAKTAIDLNIDAFITKPIDQQEFREVLSHIREEWQKKYFEELRFHMEKAMQLNKEEEFSEILAGQKSGKGVCMIFYAGDIGELFSCMKQWRAPQLYALYKNLTVFFTEEENREELFHYLCIKFGSFPKQRRTAVCVLVDRFETHMPTIAEIKEFYRKQLLQILVYGKFISCSGNTLYEIEKSAVSYHNDEEDFRKLEMILLARKWDQFPEQMERLFEIWKKDQASAWCIRKRIHSILTLCSSAGILKNDAMVLMDQIGEAIVCLDSYEEVWQYFMKVIKNNVDRSMVDPSNREAELFSRIRGLVFQNLSHNFSLQEVCTMFEVSQPYVRKIFIQFTGKTYNDFVLQEKMKAAISRINQNPGIQVKELASMFGYDPLYFGTVFKKSTGLSPSQYKQAIVDGTASLPDGEGTNFRSEE